MNKCGFKSCLLVACYRVQRLQIGGGWLEVCLVFLDLKMNITKWECTSCRAILVCNKTWIWNHAFHLQIALEFAVFHCYQRLFFLKTLLHQPMEFVTSRLVTWPIRTKTKICKCWVFTLFCFLIKFRVKMLLFTARRLPKTLLNYGAKTKAPSVYRPCRFFTEEPFKKPRLWSDEGNHILYSNDNIGGWQKESSWLLNSVDLTDIKYHSLKGFKDSNEDRIQVTELSPDVLFLGVFDGHGGSFVVDFVKDNLHMYVGKILEQGHSSLTTALRRGFIDCDMALAREVEKIGMFLLSDRFH